MLLPAPGATLNDELLAKSLGKVLTHNVRDHVWSATLRETNNDMYRPRRIIDSECVSERYR